MRAPSNSFVQTFYRRTDEIPESINACKTRAVLTEEQAIQIFKVKISDTKSFNKSVLRPLPISERFMHSRLQFHLA